VHLLLEEFKISLKLSLSTQSLSHTVSPRVGVGVRLWAWSSVFYGRSRSLTKKQGLHIPGSDS